jgi:hypothetical protein
MNFIEVVQLLEYRKNFARRKSWITYALYKPSADRVYLNKDNMVVSEGDDYGFVQLDYKGEFLKKEDVLADDWEVVE